MNITAHSLVEEVGMGYIVHIECSISVEERLESHLSRTCVGNVAHNMLCAVAVTLSLDEPNSAPLPSSPVVDERLDNVQVVPFQILPEICQ